MQTTLVSTAGRGPTADPRLVQAQVHPAGSAV